MHPAEQRLLTDDQLWELEQRYERIAYHAGTIRPRSPWAPPPPPSAPKPRVPYEVVFRKPTPAEAQTFRKQAVNEAQKHMAQEILGRACVVAVAVASKDPTKTPTITLADASLEGKLAQKEVREAFDRLLTDYPLICEAAAGELGELAGTARDEAEKG